ncbi:thioredoxin [Flavobacteriaceae bacterium]|nr:thioredoxin [Flavobacteriaceae bacterium]
MRIFYLLLCLLLIACADQPSKKVPAPIESEIIQIPDSLLGKDWEGNKILVGKINLAQLRAFTSSDWYKNEYALYKVNQSVLAEIKPLLKDKKVSLIMGTWCEDSQREVPGMIKILTEAGYPTASMEIIAVDEDKTTPWKLEKAFDLFNVPTLIFSEDGTEINRIVEFPINSLEQDILAILRGEDYKNAYAE